MVETASREGGIAREGQAVGSIRDSVALNDGARMPWLGLGVYLTREGREVEEAVKAALSCGYRSIDTAALYENERGVGKAIRESGIPRDELFVTTKLWNNRHGFDSALKAFEESRKRLGLEYVDLYLIHWPSSGAPVIAETWKAFEKLRADGRVRSIGVSNFLVRHLSELLAETGTVPGVDQVEFHPFLLQRDLLDFCRERGIRLEAWAPLVQGTAFDNPLLKGIAARRRKSVAQVLIRWDLQHGVVSIPKSVRAERIRENAQVFDFELSADEMASIDSLDASRRVGADPNHIDF